MTREQMIDEAVRRSGRSLSFFCNNCDDTVREDGYDAHVWISSHHAVAWKFRDVRNEFRRIAEVE